MCIDYMQTLQIHTQSMFIFSGRPSLSAEVTSTYIQSLLIRCVDLSLKMFHSSVYEMSTLTHCT